MKSILFLVLLVPAISFAQTPQEKAIVEEGYRLYRSEMASWYGSDIYREEYKDRHDKTGGYFSYSEGQNAFCIFFSNDDIPKALATIIFDSTYNVATAIRDKSIRDLNERELALLAIRQIALKEMTTNADKLFSFYPDTDPNIIPLVDDLGKRVFILTGPKKSGVIIFGNDYLLTFNEDNSLKEKKWIHKTIIPTSYEPINGKTSISAMHTHLPETGDYFTATDICTLLLYGKYTPWESYLVVGRENTSIWSLKKESNLTDKVKDELGNESKKKKKRKTR
jgi:hypothetical protein